MKNFTKYLVVLILCIAGLRSQAQCTLSATSSGYNAAYVQVYVLVDQNGNIVDQNTTGTFNSVVNGVYQIHALNYDPSNAPSPLPSALIGSPLTDVGSVSNGCYNADLLTDFVTQVCSSCQQVYEFCDGQNVVITSSGSSAGYTQLYVLVDAVTDIILATNATGDFTSFVSPGNSYQVFALNYNPSDPPSPLPAVGQSVLTTGSNNSGCYNTDFLTDYACVSILANSTGTDVITACDSYTWIDGNNYTSSNNTATWTLTNAVGCDSVVTLDLTINNSSVGTEIAEACDSYTWIDGNTYTASNNSAMYTFAGGSVSGCDSTVILDLTITTTPPAPEAGMDSTYCSTDNLEDLFAFNSDPSGIMTWYDMDDNFLGTGSSYPPSSNLGSTHYHVTETVNGCEGPISMVIITIEACPEEPICGELFVPNAFTPNSDTNNDSFGISVLDYNCVEDMNLKVFDRWGKVVFSSTDPYERWDGTFKDEELDQAVFHYVLDIKLFFENKPRQVKGNVTLIR